MKLFPEINLQLIVSRFFHCRKISPKVLRPVTFYQCGSGEGLIMRLRLRLYNNFCFAAPAAAQK
jgi:hypothetical protein